MEINANTIIGAAALVLSAFATWRTYKLGKVQEKLARLLLRREEENTLSDKKADLGASFVKYGSSKTKLKIWNQGKSVAKNIEIDFPEGNEVFIPSDVAAKFPLETLDRHQSVDLIAAVSIQSKAKHAIRLRWSDEFSTKNEKTLYPTV